MASPSANGGLILLVLSLLALATLTAEAMNVELTNNMNQNVGITCGFEGGAIDFGSRTLPPRQSYLFQIGNGGVEFQGLRYMCTFASMGKANTFLEVFAGSGNAINEPCHCAGAVCPWSITDRGFSCDSGRFSHGWGS